MSQQAELFPNLVNVNLGLPPGLSYRADFISEAEERALLGHIADVPFEPFHFHGYTANRRTFAFGFRYNFSKRTPEVAPEIPDWLSDVRSRIARFAGRRPDEFRQALIIEYPEGPGIGWHIDKPEFEDVAGISLASAAPMRFRKKDGEKWLRATKRLDRRSLYLMRGEVRNDWEHSISEIEETRYSLTFRTLAPTFKPDAV